MTKLEYLRHKASPTECVMTWKSLGSNIISDSTKIYSTDQLYYINIGLSELKGYLVYCNQEYIGNIDWTAGKLFDIDYGEITFGHNVATPYFTVILTRTEFDEVPINSPEFIRRYKSFVPYSNITKDGEVIINNADYQRIISVLGAPFIRELELEYSREDICNLAIRPALEEYFHWIPATKCVEVEAGQGHTSGTTWGWRKNEETGEEEWVEINDSLTPDGSLIVDLPPDCYSVVGISLQQWGGAMNGNMQSPFFFAMEQSLYSGLNYTGLSGTYTGSKKPKTQTNTVENVINSRANAQALINYMRRVHFEGPYRRADGTKYIRVYSNTQGTLNIWFARETLDFNDVEYQHRTRVFEYAQACVRQLFSALRGQSKTDIPGLVDYKDWEEKAETKKKEIRDEWKKMVKWAGVMRGSL